MNVKQRFAMALSYEGTHYHGWQTQANLASVQSTLEAALSKVAAAPIRVMCAGRTDSGVHASEQVVHFDTEVIRSQDAWFLGTNTCLPADIAVQWVKAVPFEFNARASAISRCYRYIIHNSAARPGIFSSFVTRHYRALDLERMERASQYWLGEHDFSSFRGSHCQANTPIRKLHSIRVYRQNQLIIIEVVGNAFLHHMIRNMVGTLYLIGEARQEPEWALEVLEARDRRVAGMMAPAQGLYLAKVNYPPEFELPQTPTGPFFLV